MKTLALNVVAGRKAANFRETATGIVNTFKASAIAARRHLLAAAATFAAATVVAAGMEAATATALCAIAAMLSAAIANIDTKGGAE